MANGSDFSDVFRREAAAAIQKWMDAQKPQYTQIALAKRLGYSDATTVSRNLKGNPPKITESFLERIASKIPELSWLLAKHDAIKRGAPANRQATNVVDRAALLREVGRLEEDSLEAIRRTFDAVRKMIQQ